MIDFPIKFRVAILERIGKPLVLDEIEFTGPLLSGQVLVKLFYSGICGKQIEEIDGKGGHDPWVPHLLGHEGTAEVIEIGPGVSKVTKGDTVVLHWMKGSGIHSSTPVYSRGGLQINAGWVTTFNEFAVVSENRITKISRDSDMAVGALFGCAVTTGVGVVLNEADIKSHHSVAIFGCGGVGLFAVQAANLMHPRQIIVVDINNGALSLAKEFGATTIINARSENPVEIIRGLTNGKGAERVIITTGNIQAIETAVETASVPGECFQVGVPIKGEKITLDAYSIMHKRNLRGSLGGGTFPDRDIPSYMNLNARDKLHAKKLITKVLPFESINKGIDLARGNNSGRVVIKF